MADLLAEGAIDRWSDHLSEDGYCIIPDAIAPHQIAALDRALDARFAATPFCDGAFYGRRTKRFGGLLKHAAEVEALIRHPLVLAVVERMLAPWCDRINLNLVQAIEIHPGAPAQFPHRDQDMWPGPVITTDRRAYHLQLDSTASTAMAALSWTYPQDELIAIRRAAERERAAAPVATGLAIEQLYFGYKISGDAPPWRPYRAFDDGRQTYIEFPPSISVGEAPPLFVMGPTGEAQLVNYRVAGRFYVVDRLFDIAELRLGEKRQAIVRIARGGADRRHSRQRAS